MVKGVDSELGQIGPNEPDCPVPLKPVSELRIAIRRGNTSPKRLFRREKREWLAKLDGSTAGRFPPRGNPESRLRYVLPPGRWLVFFN